MELWLRTVPVPALVPHGKEFAAAAAHAARDANSFALIGSGHSMELCDVSGTTVVVQAQSFNPLRMGMPVVYRNRRGSHVAHVPAKAIRSGWLASGVNNQEPDEERLLLDNFVGIVQAVCAAADTPFRADVAARWPLRTVSPGVPKSPYCADMVAA